MTSGNFGRHYLNTYGDFFIRHDRNEKVFTVGDIVAHLSTSTQIKLNYEQAMGLRDFLNERFKEIWDDVSTPIDKDTLAHGDSAQQ